MLRRLFWIAVGAAAALQLDRWVSRHRSRFMPSAVTGTLLDLVNERLEVNRRRAQDREWSERPL